jgi:hypothetical protein
MTVCHRSRAGLAEEGAFHSCSARYVGRAVALLKQITPENNVILMFMMWVRNSISNAEQKLPLMLLMLNFFATVHSRHDSDVSYPQGRGGWHG